MEAPEPPSTEATLPLPFPPSSPFTPSFSRDVGAPAEASYAGHRTAAVEGTTLVTSPHPVEQEDSARVPVNAGPWKQLWKEQRTLNKKDNRACVHRTQKNTRSATLLGGVRFLCSPWVSVETHILSWARPSGLSICSTLASAAPPTFAVGGEPSRVSHFQPGGPLSFLLASPISRSAAFTGFSNGCWH